MLSSSFARCRAPAASACGLAAVREGFCWAADTLGCGSASCLADCKVKLEDVSCGRSYGSMLDCAFGSHQLQMSCVDGTPTLGAECESAIMQYTTCVPQ